jgi:glycosyltransferase involved in cell wall biosynthesis
VKLVIVGDGSDAVRVRAAAGDRVIYLGRIPYKNMPSTIAGAMVSLSVQSNLDGRSDTGLSPLKVYESMACGVPVIVADLPSMADLVRDTKAGFVVACDDAGALARAVATLRHSPQIREEMGGRARQLAVERHSWEKRAADTLCVLEAVVASGSSGVSTLEPLPAPNRAIIP